MSFPAFFDTNALYGSWLNDLLLRLADRGAFRPLWSSDVMEELRRNLVKNGVVPDFVDKRLATMVTYFPDAMVSGYDDLVDGMTCDHKDRHVLAAAVRANAEVLVTFNTKDFPPGSVAPFDIEVVHPDDFLLDQLDLFPGLVATVLKELIAVYENPKITMDQLLQSLSRAGVPKFAGDVPRFL
ncbi:PIN domain-containing protein [Herbiconiux liangxiaofengii]|uniref:PIN domain-containing protein n=1 Tax=Herbiconiux liangxiaofengii TaxID=3342795 RepID=UPI0035BB4B78